MVPTGCHGESLLIEEEGGAESEAGSRPGPGVRMDLLLGERGGSARRWSLKARSRRVGATPWG